MGIIQELHLGKYKTLLELFNARQEIIKKIESLTGRPLIVYFAKFNVPKEAAQEISVNLQDLEAFNELISGIEGENLDVLVNSPGGDPNAAQRIVSLLRARFKNIRILVPHSAYSAATMLALASDKILMDERSTLGPIDPQIGGIPARAILKGFSKIVDLVKVEGAKSLPAYIPLIEKYDLHIFEICENGEKLSKSLAELWLASNMFSDEMKKDPITTKETINAIVKYFSDHDTHLSHGRPIGIDQAIAQKLKIVDLREKEHHELKENLWNLYCHFSFLTDKSPLVKVFENSKGVSYGKQWQTINFMLPQPATPPPQQERNHQGIKEPSTDPQAGKKQIAPTEVHGK